MTTSAESFEFKFTAAVQAPQQKFMPVDLFKQCNEISHSEEVNFLSPTDGEPSVIKPIIQTLLEGNQKPQTDSVRVSQTTNSQNADET